MSVVYNPKFMDEKIHANTLSSVLAIWPLMVLQTTTYIFVSVLGYCDSYSHTLVLALLTSANSCRQEMAPVLRPFPATLG